MTNEIHVVCMHCKRTIKSGTVHHAPVSHGICADCLTLKAVEEIRFACDELQPTVATFERIAQICADTLEEL